MTASNELAAKQPPNVQTERQAKELPKEQLVRLAARSLNAERFRLLDIGCSGGIDPAWRDFEPRLQALAIDASEAECQRLATLEANPDISYVAAFVGGAANCATDVKSLNRLIMRIGSRLSFMQTLEARRARLKTASTEEKLRHNAWALTLLADPSKSIVAADLLSERGWLDLDYLKIDIDGADFEVLQSFKGKLAALGVIAVQLEVNFVGTDSPRDHTFHNTDRFMRSQGFELFRLDVRTYSTRALPARYAITAPAQTVSGRPYQGDAYYALDAGADAKGLSADKLIKLAAVFATWNLPDAAAELLSSNRDKLGGQLDIDRSLDLLAAQIQHDPQGDADEILSYREYLAAFERESPRFFPSPEINLRRPTFWQRLHAARTAWRDWYYINKLETAKARAAAIQVQESASDTTARIGSEGLKREATIQTRSRHNL